MVWPRCAFMDQAPIDFSCLSWQCHFKHCLLLHFTPLGFFHNPFLCIKALYSVISNCRLAQAAQKPLKNWKVLARRNSLNFFSSPPATQIVRQTILKIKENTSATTPKSAKGKSCFYIVDNLSANIPLGIPPSLQLNCTVCLFFWWTGSLYDLKVLVYTVLTCPLHPYMLTHRLGRSSGYPIKNLSCILEMEKWRRGEALVGVFQSPHWQKHCLQNIGPPVPDRGNQNGTEEKNSSTNLNKKCHLLI